MITFFPRDIGFWRKTFDFSERYTGVYKLIAAPPKDRISFYDRDDLIGYLKEHGVRLDDAENPLEILGPNNHEIFGPGTFTVKQWTVLGWLKDDYT